LNSISDNDLMEKVKSGDVDRLGLLYTRYRKILFGYFYRLTCKRSISEDLVQNVFYRILKYRKQFRNEGKFSSWMYAIAHNVFADHLKKKKRFEYSADLSKYDIPDPCSLDDLIDQNEQQHIMKRAIGQLSDKQRETLILSRYHKMKYREIAEIMDCTVGTIKVRIFRALNNLREIYSKMEIQDL